MGKCCDGSARPPVADAIVVLGCRGSGALKRRLQIGIRLFVNGAAPLLVLSGGGSGPLPEAERMRRAAIAYGVPQSALLIDSVSGNTFENARETAKLLKARGLGSVLLVSDRAHLMRAAVLFGLHGLRVVGRAGAPAPSLQREVSAILREFVALPWSVMRALLAIGPR
ncbi:MAG TPA: YdcF family protein [Stellaceae bacterium]